MIEDIAKIFEKHYDDEYQEFSRIESPRSTRPDLAGLMLLNDIFPGHADIIADIRYITIYLAIDDTQIEQLTESQIIELLRCGVDFDADTDSLTLSI